VPGETEILAGSGRFEATRWSIVLSAQTPSDPRYLESWNELVRLYWRPVYLSIRHRWSKPVDEAKDLTQSFFARFFENRSVEAFAPHRGRFRTFLKAGLENFLRNSHRDAHRQKRLPPISGLDPEPTESANGGNLFDREWRRSLFERAIEELDSDVVRRYYLAQERPTYREIAEAAGLTESEVTNRLHEGRTRLRQIVRRLVREATHSEQDYLDEMRELFGAP
jgi:RNA polymerase sigma-70 factor (ECF subfamily)